MPTATEIRKKHFITVEEYEIGSKVKGDEDDRFILEEITQKAKPLDGLRALKKNEIGTLRSTAKKVSFENFFQKK